MPPISVGIGPRPGARPSLRATAPLTAGEGGPDLRGASGDAMAAGGDAMAAGAICLDGDGLDGLVEAGPSTVGGSFFLGEGFDTLQFEFRDCGGVQDGVFDLSEVNSAFIDDEDDYDQTEDSEDASGESAAESLSDAGWSV